MCGFEAYIGNKRVVGELQRKEEARKTYREAVAAGHGAYLMEQEEPVCDIILMCYHGVTWLPWVTMCYHGVTW